MLRGPQVEGVTRAQIVEAVKVLGVDPSDVQSLTITKGAVDVVLFVRGPDGKRVAAGNVPATARTVVPVIDDKWDRDEPVHPLVTASTVA